MRNYINEDFLTIDEVAGILKLNQQTIRNWINAGTVPHVRIGRRIRILRSDLIQLTEASAPNTQVAVRAAANTAEAFWGGTWHPEFEHREA